jgi:hypothetical protein
VEENYGLDFGGRVAAQDTEFGGGVLDFGQGLLEVGVAIGFDVEEELVFPGAAVDGAAFDFQQVDGVAGERLERGQKRAGLMGEAHGDGHFVGVGRGQCGGLFLGDEQNEAGEIFGVVLDGCGEDDAVVVIGGALTGDGSVGLLLAGKGFAHAAGGVFRGQAFPLGMLVEKLFALREGHGMGGDGADTGEGRARAADEVMLDGEDSFGDNLEFAFEEQVENAEDGTGERIFDGDEEGVGGAVTDGGERGVEGGARHGGYGFTEELHRSGFAKGAGLALKGHTCVVQCDGHAASAGSCSEDVMAASLGRA